MVGHLDHGDLEAAMGQVLGHLKTDEATAHDDRTLLGAYGLEPRVVLHAGQEAGAPLDPFADLPGVGHGPHLEDARQVDPGERRSHRCRTR